MTNDVDIRKLQTLARVLLEAITERTTVYTEFTAVHGKSLLAQLRDAINGDTRKGGGGSVGFRSSIVLSVEALDLMNEIEKIWKLPNLDIYSSFKSRHRDMMKRVEAAQLQSYVNALQWVHDSINSMLNPSKRWTVNAPCPKCHNAMFQTLDSTGEWVQMPTLVIDMDNGAQCRFCDARWPLTMLTELGDELGIPRGWSSPPEPDTLSADG